MISIWPRERQALSCSWVYFSGMTHMIARTTVEAPTMHCLIARTVVWIRATLKGVK